MNTQISVKNVGPNRWQIINGTMRARVIADMNQGKIPANFLTCIEGPAPASTIQSLMLVEKNQFLVV